MDRLAAEVSDDRDLSQEVLAMRYERTLSESGLSIEGGPLVIYPMLNDGQALAQALNILPTDPAAHDRLRDHMENFFINFILTARDFTIVHQTDRVEAIAGQVPEHWVPLQLEDWPQITAHSIRQAAQHAPALAERLEALGVREQARLLQQMANYIYDGDLVPWAMASWCGFLREAPPGGGEADGRDWEKWESDEQWQLLFRILHATNPAGAFGSHLKQQALEAMHTKIRSITTRERQRDLLLHMRQRLTEYPG
jgi:hypothetical protein